MRKSCFNSIWVSIVDIWCQLSWQTGKFVFWQIVKHIKCQHRWCVHLPIYQNFVIFWNGWCSLCQISGWTQGISPASPLRSHLWLWAQKRNHRDEKESGCDLLKPENGIWRFQRSDQSPTTNLSDFPLCCLTQGVYTIEKSLMENLTDRTA